MFENKQAVNNDLNLIQAFNTIDKDKKGSITRQDLLKFLNKFVKNAQFTMDDIINLFRRLNIEEDDRIGYLQFMNLILPSQKQELNEDLIVQQRESRSLDRVSNYQNARQTKVSREKSKENDFNKRKSTYQDEFASKNYSSFNSISKINTTASSKKRQTTSMGKEKQVFSSNMRTVNTPSKFTTVKRRQSNSKEKNQQKYSLRYNEIRDIKQNISKSFDQSKSSNNVSKYKQTRFKKSQIKQEPIKESKQSKYQDQKTPRSRSKSRLEQTKNSEFSSLYENTIVNSPMKSSMVSKAQFSYISTPARTSSMSQAQSRLSIKKNDQDNYMQNDEDNFDQEQYNIYHKMRRGYVSPMKGKEEDYFIGILKDLLKLENAIEEIKEELIMYCNDFNPVQAFRIFVSNPEKGKNINIYNLREAYEVMMVPLTNHESELLMKRLDSNRDGQLTYTDICDIFRPKNKALAKEFDQRMPFELQISQKLSEGSTFYIKKLFYSLIKVENHIEHIKIQLNQRPKFDIQEAFNLLNLDGFAKVSQEDIQNILRIHGLITFPREINPLFTRFDKDKDGLINFSDFQHEITPFAMHRII